MTRFVLSCLKFYQQAVSPYLGENCRFFPSCSHYVQDAVAKKGIARGIGLGFLRILRCQPFSAGGYDPVE